MFYKNVSAQHIFFLLALMLVFIRECTRNQLSLVCFSRLSRYLRCSDIRRFSAASRIMTQSKIYCVTGTCAVASLTAARFYVRLLCTVRRSVSNTAQRTLMTCVCSQRHVYFTLYFPSGQRQGCSLLSQLLSRQYSPR